ncbi:AIPR family protein [Chloroflexota bacterium]
MTTQNTLEEFAENLQQDALALAESEENGQMLADSFTQTVVELMSEAGECEDPIVCYHRATGLEVSGYSVDEEEGRLDLFLSIHTNTIPPETVTRQRIEVGFRRLKSFFEWCFRGGYVDLEESSPVFDMASHIYQVRDDLTQLRLYVITDGKTTVTQLPQDTLNGLDVLMSLWDIVRLHRLDTSGKERSTISVDFQERLGKPIPCLETESIQQGYRAFLTLLPGNVLREIYADFGPRLLERNVRSFLQARGKVNRGIRDTISNEPEKFLAYNNGITVTGETVHLSGDNKAPSISRIDGLQIVNGGQTTASLLATNRGKADLSKVFVATKLIEIETGEHEELARKVSRYANTQNRITEADFSANDPFHVKLEEFSRTIWAPAVGGTQRQTKWFYERARGQYQDARASQLTPARRRVFASENPPGQRFNKTDLAKFENTWDELPYIVSRGAQKNFSDFMIRLAGRELTVDRTYFERLVSKAILFRMSERIVQRQEFGGYRANIVSYTIALLAHSTSQTIDLERIWREQTLTPSLQEAIAKTSHEVFRIITNPPNAQNITEWCKNEKCWGSVRSGASREAFGLIQNELLGADAVKREAKRKISEFSPKYVENLKQIVELSSDGWHMLMEWGAETNALDPSQRQLALSISRAIRIGKTISSIDSEKAVEILDRADELGFKPLAS